MKAILNSLAFSRAWVCLIGFIGFTSCASNSILSLQNRTWTEQVGRNFEKQNIVMVSLAKAASQNTAKFNAEAQGLEDLANECSFIPKGTHLADQVVLSEQGQVTVFVKFIVAKTICENAKISIKFQEIWPLVNYGYTEQILKYHAENEKSIVAKGSALGPLQKVELILNSENASIVRDDNDFFMTRQQISFLKQATLLAGRGLFPEKAFDIEKMQSVLVQKIAAAGEYEKINPALKSSSITWTMVKERISQNAKSLEALENQQSLTQKKLQISNGTRRPASRKPAQRKSAPL